jgi:hypothetical protein
MTPDELKKLHKKHMDELMGRSKPSKKLPKKTEKKPPKKPPKKTEKKPSKKPPKKTEKKASKQPPKKTEKKTEKQPKRRRGPSVNMTIALGQGIAKHNTAKAVVKQMKNGAQPNDVIIKTAGGLTPMPLGMAWREYQTSIEGFGIKSQHQFKQALLDGPIGNDKVEIILALNLSESDYKDVETKRIQNGGEMMFALPPRRAKSAPRPRGRPLTRTFDIDDDAEHEPKVSKSDKIKAITKIQPDGQNNYLKIDKKGNTKHVRASDVSLLTGINNKKVSAAMKRSPIKKLPDGLLLISLKNYNLPEFENKLEEFLSNDESDDESDDEDMSNANIEAMQNEEAADEEPYSENYLTGD